MKNQIMFSIIIPTYKRSDKIIRSIESILRQEYDNYEIIVVDDNDENSIYRKENEEKLKKYIQTKQIKYIKHKKNKNGAAARNSGIKVAKGEYITFLDDDDEFEKSRLKVVSDTILKENKPDFIYTGFIIKNKGKITKMKKFKYNNIVHLIYLLLCQKSFIGTGSNMICKKELINKINGFDEKFNRHQDIEFLIRYLNISKSVYAINRYLVIKNNDDNMNLPDVNNLLETKKMFLKKYKNIIERYSNNKKKKIYYYNYYELLNIAYIKNRNEDIKNVISILKKNRIYNYINVKKIQIKHIIKRIIK